MADDRPAELVEREFRYPREPWGFVLLCYTWLVALFAIQYYGHLTGEAGFTYWPGLIALIVLVCVLVWGVPVRLFIKAKPIILRQDGISVGKRFASWEVIEQIDGGPFMFRRRFARIKFRCKRRGLFRRKRETLGIQGYPFVYRELIPAIAAKRPDIEVSQYVRDLLREPEKAGAPRRCLVAFWLFVNGTLLAMTFLPTFQNFLAYFIIGCALITPSNLRDPALPIIRTPKDRFIKFALTCPFILGLSVQAHLFSTADRAGLELIVGTGIVISLAAMVVLFAVKKLTGRVEFCIVLAFLIPLGFYQAEIGRRWQAKDISNILDSKESIGPVWGRTGRYLTCSNGRYLIDVTTLKPQATPKHEGSGLAFWLDERFLVRAVWEDRQDGELWVYDHRSKQEMRVPTAERFSVGFRQPVSGDGRLLAWIDSEQEGSVQKIRLWNLEAQKEQGSAYILPDAVNWAGHGANWTAGGGIVVYGRVKSEQSDSEDGYELHVFHIRRDRDEIVHLKSPCPAGRWYPCPNWRYALGASKAERDELEVTLVDFKKGTLIAVGNGFHANALPLRLAEYLYWVKRENGKACLVRLEYASMRESVVCPVSRDMAVEAVTEDGRLALLGLSRESLFGFPAYEVVQTATGKRHRIRPPGWGKSGRVAVRTGCPARMPLSPDGRMLVVQSRGPGYLTTLLYKVPPEWVGLYDASGSVFTR